MGAILNQITTCGLPLECVSLGVVYLKKIYSPSPRCCQLSIVSELGVELGSHFTFSGILPGLSLHRSCPCCLSCPEFVFCCFEMSRKHHLFIVICHLWLLRSFCSPYIMMPELCGMCVTQIFFLGMSIP